MKEAVIFLLLGLYLWQGYIVWQYGLLPDCSTHFYPTVIPIYYTTIPTTAGLYMP